MNANNNLDTFYYYKQKQTHFSEQSSS